MFTINEEKSVCETPSQISENFRLIQPMERILTDLNGIPKKIWA
jgi:hypothetical protein